MSNHPGLTHYSFTFILDLTVNALVVGKVNPMAKDTQKTYFGKIGIVLNGTTAVISPRQIQLNGVTHHWKRKTMFK